MPKQILVESRNQTLTFPDDATQEEINQAVSEAFPREGQDVAFDLQKFQQEGGDVKDFIANISDDDYIKLNNFRSDKKMTAAEMGGIALDAAGTLVKDVLKGAYAAGKTMVEASAKGDNLATAKVLSSAARGVGAGTIDLAQLGLKLLDPTQRIPTFDEFAKQPVNDYGYAYGPAPSVTSRAATPDDYKNLIDSERKKELAALEMVEAADKLVQGAALEDVAKGARFIDAFTITGLAKGLAKGVGKGIAKKGFYESAAKLPAATKAAEFTAKAAETAGNLGATGVQAAAKTVETAAKVANAPINLARNLIKNETAQALVGAGLGYRQGDIEGAVAGTLGATVGLRAASAALKGIAAGADFIGSAAKVAKTGASRSGLFEKMAVDSGISQSARNIAKALLPAQPAFQFAGQVAKETAKDFIPAAGIGAGLGYMAGGEEGAAAGVGSALGVSALTGPIKASVSAVKTLAKAPTARGDANALGDIKTFVNAIPDEKSRIQYAQIMDQAIKVAGPERAADMLDALRLAEAHGATVVVGPKNSPNAFDIVGNTISINPSRLNAGTVFHETTHQLVNVGIRASLLPELRNLYDGIRDADGNILKQGLYTEADWAAKAKELAESYKNNPQGYQMALDVASKLENPAGYSPEAIQAAKDFVLDEATASYAERLMGRSRPGAFNPDRLPMWHRNLLEQIDQRVIDNLATELYSGQTNLNTPSKAFTDANGRPVRIPQLDVILRKALSGKYPKSGGAMPKQAAPKTVPIPKNPVDVAKFAQSTFGATRDILGTDENGNPRLLTEKEHQAVAKADYEAAVQAFQQLSPDDQATVRLVNRKGEPASITDKDYQIQITSATPEPVFDRFLQVAKDRGMGNQQLATMRQLYASMVSPEGPTFDTVNNPVWRYSKRTGQMESTVRPPTRQEIYPLFIHVNSAGGFNVKYIDLSRLKQNAQKIMSDPKHKGIWPSMDAFMDDFKRSMRNLSAEGKQPDTPSGSKSTAELLGNGDENLGAVKRDLIAEALNVTLPERLKSKGYENEPVFEPLSLIGKEKRGKRIGESAFRDFRIERVTEITPTNERLKVVQENAYDKLVRRFQPDSFTPETLPNGEAWTNPDGYRILKKTGSKLYRVYDKDGTEIGVASSQDAAIQKAQDSFLKSEKKAENVRFQPITPEQDAAFVAAEKAGDVETGLKLATEAAKAAGYDVGIAEHRTNSENFNVFDMGKAGSSGGIRTDYHRPAVWFAIASDNTKRMLALLESKGFNQPYGKRSIKAYLKLDPSKDFYLKEKSGTEIIGISDPNRIKSADPFTYDDAGNLIPLSQRFNPGSNDIRFQPDENLVTVHNLTEPNLKHALKVGGLAVPSLAVVRTDLSNFDSFGDITLLAKPNLIDPQLNKSSKVFNADIYSPRYPTVKTVFKRSELDKVSPIFKGYYDELANVTGKGWSWSTDNLSYMLEDEGFNRIQYNRLAQYAYLRDAGLIEPPKQAIDSYEFDELLRKQTNELRDEVVNFVQSKLDNAGVKYEEKIPDGYTNSGTRRFLPHDLDTVVKIMTRKLKDGEGFNYGVASIRAANAKPFKTLKAIKNNRDKIITSEKMETLKKEVDQEFMTLAESALNARKSKPSFGGLDAVSDDMKALVQGDNSWIREMYGDSPVVQDMKTFVAKLRDMPTEYFEAKVKRAVKLQEFEAAVVPMNTHEDVKAALRRNGLAVREYDPNNKDSRKTVIQSVSSEFNIRFQPDPSMPSVLNGSNGTRIIKSNSGKFRVYSGTGALLGIRDTQQAAEKLATKP